MMNRLWVLALGTVLVLTFFETSNLHERIQKLSALDSGFPVEKIQSNETVSGYQSDLRFAVLPDRSDDLHWIANAQLAHDQDLLRLRRVDYDNNPHGREVHWSSVYSVWIRMLAKLETLFSEESLPVAINNAAFYANIVLASIAMIALAWLCASKFGSVAGSVVAISFASFIPFRDQFKYAVGDHHALAIIASTFGLFFLLNAICGLKAHAQRSNRNWSLPLSSLFFAIGLWVNAVSQIPVFFAIGCFALFDIFLSQSKIKGDVANIWRQWGLFGSALSLLFYLIEYAPSHLGLRLEVNHPLYALAWLGAGECLYQLKLRKISPSVFSMSKLLLALLAILPLPVLIFVERGSVFQVADPFLMAMHDRYIMEFQSLWANIEVQRSAWRSAVMLVPVALLVLLWLKVFRIDTKERDSLLFLLFPSTLLFVLTLFQARWWGHFSATLILPVAVSLMVKGNVRLYFKNGYVMLVYLFLVPGFLFTGLSAFSDIPFSQRELQRVVEKGVAHAIRMRSIEGTPVVLSSPDATTTFIYFGGIRGIGTYYWENHEGLKRAAELFSQTDFEEASRKISESGVTHIVLYSWGGFEKEYLELYRDFEDSELNVGESLLMKLVTGRSVPDWLRPIPYQIPSELGGSELIALIFEVVDRQTEGEVIAGRFEYSLEMGWTKPAYAMVRAMNDQPDSLPAQISLARLYGISGQQERLLRTLDRIAALRDAGNPVSLENRVRLSGVLAVAGRSEEAKELLSETLAQLDETEISKFYPETIMQLLQMVELLDLRFQKEEMERSCLRLLPTRLRKLRGE